MSQPTTTTPLFGGSNSASTSARKPLYTGLNVFTILGVNPTKEQIEEWNGSEYKLRVDYTIQTVNERRVRPVEVWLQSLDGYIKAESIRFLIGMDDDINRNGTVRYVNELGEFCQGKTDPGANPKMDWFTKSSYRVAKQGEYELYSFMQALMRYNSRDKDAGFMRDAEGLGVTVENIFDGNFDGVNKFFQWSTENDNRIVLLTAVRRSEKVGENGEKRYYDNQTIVGNPDYFYRTQGNEVQARSFKNISDEMEKGRRITNSMFTIYFQEFREEDCLNKVPDQTAQEDSPNTTKTFGSWLNK